MKQKKSNSIIGILVILILVLVLIMLFLLGKALIQDTLEEDFLMIVFLIFGIGGLAYFLNINMEKTNASLSDIKTVQFDSADEYDVVTTSELNKKNNDNTQKQKMNDFIKKKSPVLVLIIVFAIFIFTQYGGSIFNTSIIGRFEYDMAEGELIGGVINQTDYWYMEFYENGTLDVGWKNIGFPEDSQGHGVWYQSGKVYIVTIYYDYGSNSDLSLVIKGKELFNSSTNTSTNYIKVSD